MRRRIGRAGNSASLLLSQDVLGLMGVQIGDEVDLSLVDRALVVRPVPEVERTGRVRDAVTSVMQDWDGLFRRLARGPEPGTAAKAPVVARAKPRPTRASTRPEPRAARAKAAKRPLR